MNDLKCFATTITEFYLNDLDLQQQVFDLLKTMPMRTSAPGSWATVQTDPDLHHRSEFSQFFAWVNQCLLQLYGRNGFDCDSLRISSSWANRDLAGQNQHQIRHHHSVSMLSAVYYCTEGSDLMFWDPVTQRRTGWAVNSRDYQPTVLYPVRPGYMIVFPSWLEHETIPHGGDHDRWSIAFNILPQGLINNRSARSGEPIARIQIL